MGIFNIKAKAKAQAEELAKNYDIQYNPGEQTFSIYAKANPELMGRTDAMVGADKFMHRLSPKRRATTKAFEEIAQRRALEDAQEKQKKGTGGDPKAGGPDVDPKTGGPGGPPATNNNEELKTILLKLQALEDKYDKLYPPIPPVIEKEKEKEIVLEDFDINTLPEDKKLAIQRDFDVLERNYKNERAKLWAVKNNELMTKLDFSPKAQKVIDSGEAKSMKDQQPIYQGIMKNYYQKMQELTDKTNELKVGVIKRALSK